MAVMLHDEWMRRTNAGPRSAFLLAVDRAVKDYTLRPSADAAARLNAAVLAWAAEIERIGKDVLSADYPFNRDGAVEELFIGLADEQDAWDKDANAAAGKAALATAKHHIARMDRPATFTRDIKIGKIRFDRKRLKPAKVAGLNLATIVSDPTHPNVSYEGFDEDELLVAQCGWDDVLDCNSYAGGWLRESSLLGVPPNFRTWFGECDDAALKAMRKRGKVFDLALRTRPITFVLRRSHEIRYVDARDPLGATTDETHSNGTFGYVWSAGNQTGSGVRVVLYQACFDEPCRYEGMAQTMIHELSHKLLGTSDKPIGGGADVYGKVDCKALAARDPASARNLADCWGYFYISYRKKI